MNRAPAFQFYPKDWLDFRVQRMSLQAQGAYLKVLCFMWADSDDQCSVTDNDGLLARAIGTTVEHWLELRAEIQCESDPILKEKRGRLISARLRHEALNQRKYRKQQSEKGKRSAKQRSNCGSTAVQPMYQPKGNSSSSSSSSKTEEEKNLPAESLPEVPTGRNGKHSLADDEWLTSLRSDPAFTHINFDFEIAKAKHHLELPKNRGRHFTRRYFLNWIGRIDPPMNGDDKALQGKRRLPL